MAKYSEWVNYFQQLATENNLIKHTTTKKKFYRMNIEELFSSTPSGLPAPKEGPFLVFINFIVDADYKARATKQQEMMVMLLQGHKRGDYDAENLARDNAEIATDQILRRMRNDSLSDHPFFEHSFDTIQARSIPLTIPGNINYSGWQTTFKINASFNACYDASNWTTP